MPAFSKPTREKSQFEKDLFQIPTNKWIYSDPKYDAVFDMYQKHKASFWTEGEIDMGDDVRQWESNQLTISEKSFILTILAFFAASDGIVMENLSTNFLSEVELPEAKSFYIFQNMMEEIHSRTYSMLITSLVKNNKLLETLFSSVTTHMCIRDKAQWAQKYMNDSIPFSKRLIAFSIVEGIFFSGSFCAVFWLKKRGLMPGVAFANELISRDEGLHTDFACLLYNKLEDSWPYEVVLEILTEAVNLEKAFIESCFENGKIYQLVGGFYVDENQKVPTLTEDIEYHKLKGMNKELMSQYIEFVADRHLVALGYNKHYYTQNPFDWMELISLQGKTNFFERRVTEYQKTGVLTKGDDNVFTLDASF